MPSLKARPGGGGMISTGSSLSDSKLRGVPLHAISNCTSARSLGDKRLTVLARSAPCRVKTM
eukprot:6482792-Amphidinium_carterae.1